MRSEINHVYNMRLVYMRVSRVRRPVTAQLLASFQIRDVGGSWTFVRSFVVVAFLTRRARAVRTANARVRVVDRPDLRFAGAASLALASAARRRPVAASELDAAAVKY